MRPAVRFLQTVCSVGTGFVELGIALLAVRMQDATGLDEMALDMFSLPNQGEAVDRSGRRTCSPRPWIADIDPDTAPLHRLVKAAVPDGPVQNPDQGVVGMEKVAGHHIGLDPFDQGCQHLYGAPTSVDQRAVGMSAPIRTKISFRRWGGR